MDISKVARIPTPHKHAISTSERASFQTLNEQLKKLDDVRAQTDELLFQMIPKQVADRLRYVCLLC